MGFQMAQHLSLKHNINSHGQQDIIVTYRARVAAHDKRLLEMWTLRWLH